VKLQILQGRVFLAELLLELGSYIWSRNVLYAPTVYTSLSRNPWSETSCTSWCTKNIQSQL